MFLKGNQLFSLAVWEPFMWISIQSPKACMCLLWLSAAFKEDLMSVEQSCVPGLATLHSVTVPLPWFTPLPPSRKRGEQTVNHARMFHCKYSYHNPVLSVKACSWAIYFIVPLVGLIEFVHTGHKMHKIRCKWAQNTPEHLQSKCFFYPHHKTGHDMSCIFH